MREPMKKILYDIIDRKGGRTEKVFGDPVVASAIADRLCHHCTLLRITGRSYRMKDLVPEDAGAGRGKEDRDG